MGRLLVVLGMAAGLGLGCAGSRASSPGEPRARGVRAAALPYRILAAHGGAEIAEAEWIARLSLARAVCIGEHHPNPHDHWAQLHVFERLLNRNRGARRTTGLGLEMIQRPFQGVLDDFAAGKISEAALLSRTGWKDRWGYDFGLYRPVLEAAIGHGARMIALNAPREQTKRVSRDGLDALTPAERAALPELVLDDPDHRAWWNTVMRELGSAEGHTVSEAAAAGKPGEVDPARAERIYTAQVLWDESMADAAARWLAQDRSRQVVILAGSGHCHESAIVRRLERRGVGDVVSVHPLIDNGDGELAGLLARPQNDYVFVMSRE